MLMVPMTMNARSTEPFAPAAGKDGGAGAESAGNGTEGLAGGGGARESYSAAVEALFVEYHATSVAMLEYFKSITPRPEEMKAEAYERTLKARAFDVARYLLPLATNTSLGQIVNARTLETQVSRLLTSEFAEVRQIAKKLRIAATEPAWNVTPAAAQGLCAQTDPVES